MTPEQLAQFIEKEFTDESILQNFIESMKKLHIESLSPWEMFITFLAWNSCGNEKDFKQFYSYLYEQENK